MHCISCGDLPKAVSEIKKHMQDCVVAINKVNVYQDEIRQGVSISVV